ncbi:MAG: hypothetical protein ABIK62_07820, partial [candidate division WOR-3 bacterium]
MSRITSILGWSRRNIRPGFAGLLGLGLWVGAGQAYNLYRANLHSHTGYSDGDSASVPRDAYVYARDTARIDVLGVTDHAEVVEPWEWDSTRAMAAAATTPGVFVALAGFEWTGSDGHMCAWFTDDYTSWLLTPTPPLFYSWLLPHPKVVGQFCHPFPDNYYYFAYSTEGDSSVTALEMQWESHALVYVEALDSGWHVGMTANQDNHDRSWGARHQMTGIWADSLT